MNTDRGRLRRGDILHGISVTEKNRQMSKKLPKNVGDFGKSIVTKGFKKFPKVQ